MDGIINIYKESGYTSHDVVACLRGILKTKKIGHAGTLDPMAEGVLPVCVGNATKLCEMLADHDKEYEAVMILGKTYDTLDVTGVLQEEREVMSTNEEIIVAVKSFEGGYDQVPPMYSAKKVDGKKLYDLARSGKVVERKSVPVKIYQIDITELESPHVTMKISCGKGTYIRSLIDDIGKKLGCGAAMEKLTRTRSGEYEISGAHKLSEIERAMEEGRISDVIISLESFFSALPAIRLNPELSKLLRNGNVIRYKASDDDPEPESLRDVQKDGNRYRMYDCDGRFAGIYEYKKAEDLLKPYKMFLN